MMNNNSRVVKNNNDNVDDSNSNNSITSDREMMFRTLKEDLNTLHQIQCCRFKDYVDDLTDFCNMLGLDRVYSCLSEAFRH